MHFEKRNAFQNAKKFIFSKKTEKKILVSPVNFGRVGLP